MKRFFLVLALLLVICLVPAVAEGLADGLFEVDVSPDIVLISDAAILAGGGVSGIVPEFPAPPFIVSSPVYNYSKYPLSVSRYFISTPVSRGNFNGWISLKYYLRI